MGSGHALTTRDGPPDPRAIFATGGCRKSICLAGSHVARAPRNRPETGSKKTPGRGRSYSRPNFSWLHGSISGKFPKRLMRIELTGT